MPIKKGQKPVYTGEWEVIEDGSVKAEDIKYTWIVNRQLYVCTSLKNILSQPGSIALYCDAIQSLEMLLAPYWTSDYIKNKKKLEEMKPPEIQKLLTKEENYRLFDWEKAQRFNASMEQFVRKREDERLLHLIRLMDVRNLLLQETADVLMEADIDDDGE